MAIFKCLRSGNTIQLYQEDDIERMATHEGYIRLDLPQALNKGENHGLQANEENAVAKDAVEAQPGENAEAEVIQEKPVVRRGRPKKQAEATEFI